jgi:hypothetical protein
LHQPPQIALTFLLLLAVVLVVIATLAAAVAVLADLFIKQTEA